MPARRSRSLHRSVATRAIGGLTVLVLVVAGCGPNIGGAAVLPAGSAGATAQPAPSVVASSTAGQITIPRSGAGGGATNSASRLVPASSSTAPANPAPEPAPAALANFYGQHLTWGGCADFATSADDAAKYASDQIQCARLVVPLSYDDPSGPTITTGLLREPATDPAHRIGSVLLDPGGPGASGMSFAADLALPTQPTAGRSGAPAVAAELNRRFDLVGFDPRGVGSSLPLISCQTDAERDAQRRVIPRSATAAEVSEANADLKKIVGLCVSRIGAQQGIDSRTFLANVGTASVVKDLDVTRAVLGEAKLTYAGFSYGTRIGWTYAEQFPTKVRAMVLDGMVSPDHDPATSAIAQIAAFQKAFDAFATWCATTSPGCVLGTDPARATAVFQFLVRPLLDHPLGLPYGRELSFSDAITGAEEALYYDSYRSILAAALVNLSKGDGRLLMQLADKYYDRDSSGRYGSISDAYNAIRCVDGPTPTSPTDITKFNAAYAAAAPFQDSGDPPGAVADICAFWPVKPTGTPHRLNAPGVPQVLIISTTGDPATPYQNGVDVSKQINSRLLTVQGTRHTAYLGQRLPCVDAIGNAYLENLTLPADGTTCS